MISIASVPEYSIKVIKLIFGIFPYKTIWEYSAKATTEKKAHEELINLCLGQTGKKAAHPLNAIIIKLLACKSCTEAGMLLRKAEQEAGN